MKEEWTNANKRHIKSYYNIIKKEKPEITLDNYDFLEENYEILEEYYKDKAQETKKKLYSTLCKYFTFRYTENKSTKYLRLRKYFEEQSTQETKEIKKTKLTNTEDNVNYDLYVTLDDIDEKIKSYDEIKYRTIDDNLEYLLLHVIYNGALRTSFYEKLKIASSKSNIPEEENYVYINSKAGYYYVESDKVSSTEIFKKEERKKILFDEEFKNVVYLSVQKYPRTFLFNDWSDAKINNTLKEIFKQNDVNISYFRKIYETCTYVNAIISGKMVQWMENCYRLRHSSNIAMQEYVQDFQKVPKLREKISSHFGNNDEALKRAEIAREKNDDEFDETIDEREEKRREQMRLYKQKSNEKKRKEANVDV